MKAAMTTTNTMPQPMVDQLGIQYRDERSQIDQQHPDRGADDRVAHSRIAVDGIYRGIHRSERLLPIRLITASVSRRR